MKKTKFRSEMKFLPTNVDEKAMFWVMIEISILSVAKKKAILELELISTHCCGWKKLYLEPKLNFYPLVQMKKAMFGPWRKFLH